MRDEVRSFALAMEEQLQANDHKPGWQGDSCYSLFVRLREEADELLMALRDHGDVQKEAADVANFAMMIADNWSRKDGFRQRFAAARAESGDNMPMGEE